MCGARKEPVSIEQAVRCYGHVVIGGECGQHDVGVIRFELFAVQNLVSGTVTEI
jgi:hypothetical protein